MHGNAASTVLCRRFLTPNYREFWSASSVFSRRNRQSERGRDRAPGKFVSVDKREKWARLRLGRLTPTAVPWNVEVAQPPNREAISSRGEVNWLIDGLCGECLPAIDLAHVDLTGGEQIP